jgi:DNA replication ATP-dependent helicase Dna2
MAVQAGSKGRSAMMIESVIDSVGMEIRRLEDPRNRTRYFLFGKSEDLETDEVIGFTFQNAPDRVLREARWSATRREECLFKIGDAFVAGFMGLSGNGVTVDFTLEELATRGVSVASLLHASDRGIEFVMDSRELTQHLFDFLDARRAVENPFLGDILGSREPAAIRPVAGGAEYPDLNASQSKAIERALSQRVTFVWGPPGTGKTKTMAALAARLVRSKKRVLLSATSNMALDQLLLATVARLGKHAPDTTIARTGSQMSEAAVAYGRSAFERKRSGSARAASAWEDHVGRSSLVASNFTVLTLPNAPRAGEFDYVLADEVSMANIPSVVAASFYANTGMALGGDPFQLSPIYPDEAEEPNEFFRWNVFEMASVGDRHDPRVAFLDTQYRMQEEIGDLVSDLFYDNELKTGTAPVGALAGFGSRVLFAQRSGRVEFAEEDAAVEADQRRFNEAHAETVADCVVDLLNAGVPGQEIGVITPYNAQLVVILGMLQAAIGEAGPRMGGLVKVSTIHSFQGQERRAIIVDLTDDNVRPSPLTAKRELINVALSRAKEQLVIVGNRHYLVNEEFFGKRQVEMFERMLSHAAVIGG